MSASPDRMTLQAAAEWYTELRDAEPNSPAHEAHNDWLDQDPSHRRAWERIEKLKTRLDSAPSIITQSTLKKARAMRHQGIKLLMVFMIFGGTFLGWLQTDSYQRMMADYSTVTGERKQLTLADGSLIELNTNSAVNVRFDETTRRISLVQGEIQVTTAKDKQSRPFIVNTQHGEIRALGTRFLVRKEKNHSVVTVLEHAVEIKPAASSAQPIRLESGQMVSFTSQTVESVEPVTGYPAAWTNGLLIVSNWTLDEFLDELSRHQAGFLRYDDEIARLRISGAFHLDNIDAVLDNLTTTLPVAVHRQGPYWTRVELQNP